MEGKSAAQLRVDATFRVQREGSSLGVVRAPALQAERGADPGRPGRRLSSWILVAVGVLLASSAIGCKQWRKEREKMAEGVVERLDTDLARADEAYSQILIEEGMPAAASAVQSMNAIPSIRAEAKDGEISTIYCFVRQLIKVVKAVVEGADTLISLVVQLKVEAVSIFRIGADAYRAELRAVGISVKPAGAAEGLRHFELAAGQQLSLRLGADIEETFEASGSLTLDLADLEAGGKVKLESLGLRLAIPALLEPTILIRAASPGAVLRLERSDATFRGGWKGTLDAPLVCEIPLDPDAPPLVTPPAPFLLELHLDATASQLLLTTRGWRSAEELSPGLPPPPPHRIGFFFPEPQEERGGPLRFRIEKGPPGASVELFASPRTTYPEADFHGIPWALEQGAQRLVAEAVFDADGVAHLEFAREALEKVGPFLQALVGGVNGVWATVCRYDFLPPEFRRGDANADGGVDIADALMILGHLFLEGGDPPCAAAADANADGTLNLSDAVTTLQFLFTGGDEPPPPGPWSCGRAVEPSSSDLPCGSYSSC